ncbi:hypothetical protein KCU83_g3355, partial [Aureobasidium melanogenum]
MSEWIQIDHDEAAKMFEEAVGALALHITQGSVQEAVITALSRPALHLNTGEQQSAVKSIVRADLALLGTCIFVYPYERYKKLVARHPDRNLDPSKAFGLDPYTNRENFTRAFPHAIITTWVPDAGRASWFADCVRNSLAHAQTVYVNEGSRTVVQIWNARDGLDPNFDVTLEPNDFMRLVSSALTNFVRTIVVGGAPQPLQKLLDDLQP